MEKWKKDARKEAMVVGIEPFPKKRTQNRIKKLNKMQR